MYIKYTIHRGHRIATVAHMAQSRGYCILYQSNSTSTVLLYKYDTENQRVPPFKHWHDTCLLPPYESRTENHKKHFEKPSFSRAVYFGYHRIQRRQVYGAFSFTPYRNCLYIEGRTENMSTRNDNRAPNGRIGHHDLDGDTWSVMQDRALAPVTTPILVRPLTADSTHHHPTQHRITAAAYTSGTAATADRLTTNPSRSTELQHRLGTVPVRFQFRPTLGRNGAMFNVRAERKLTRSQRRMAAYNAGKERGAMGTSL